MRHSQQREDEDNQSSDDEIITDANLKPRVRMIERYSSQKSKKLKQLVSSYDDDSTIDLSCQNLTDHDMETVLEYTVREKGCTILNLWKNRFTSESMSILAHVLDGNDTLIELDLSNNFISDNGVKILSKFLSLNTCVLNEIDLSSNGITDQGVKYLADMLRRNKQLKILSLNNNEITDNGLISLADALITDNKTLTELKVELNPRITRRGVESILHSLKDNTILENIYLKECDIFGERKTNLELKALQDELEKITLQAELKKTKLKTELEELAFQTGFYVIL